MSLAMMIDAHGRKINYLRLSVTDRCNLRCRYCMPADGVPWLPRGGILSYEELFLVARTAVSLGIEKIRVTGGEPLIRKGILGFLARLGGIPGLRQLVLTTNGLLLKEMAEPLKRTGVQRLNISIDSLVPETFRGITRGGDVSRVHSGIAAAEAAGFPIKLNMVVMRGVNDPEVVDFAALTLDKPYAVRFIEFMPSSADTDWQSMVVPGREILDRISKRFDFSRVEPGGTGGARERLPDPRRRRDHRRDHPRHRTFLRRVQPDPCDRLRDGEGMPVLRVGNGPEADPAGKRSVGTGKSHFTNRRRQAGEASTSRRTSRILDPGHVPGRRLNPHCPCRPRCGNIRPSCSSR